MDYAEIPEDAIELSGLIRKIRSELALAQHEGEESLTTDDNGNQVGLRFDVGDIELEVNVVASGKMEGGIAAKLFVLTPSVKANLDHSVTQKLKLKLKPRLVTVDSNTGERFTSPAQIGAEGK